MYHEQRTGRFTGRHKGLLCMVDFGVEFCFLCSDMDDKSHLPMCVCFSLDRFLSLLSSLSRFSTTSLRASSFFLIWVASSHEFSKPVEVARCNCRNSVSIFEADRLQYRVVTPEKGQVDPPLLEEHLTRTRGGAQGALERLGILGKLFLSLEIMIVYGAPGGGISEMVGNLLSL